MNPAFQDGKDKAGLIRLTSFNARAQRDIKSAIQELEGKGAKRFVLDLRDNRGGLVSEGLEVRGRGPESTWGGSCQRGLRRTGFL